MQRHSTADSRQPEFRIRHSSLVTRHLSLVIAALAAFAASAAPVYLKAGASGANNGSSWTDAYTNVVTAVNAALAGDGLLYAAGGVYVFSGPVSTTSSLAVYGGFAGESMDETPATRDTAAHPTVFSGDTGGDDYWVHYEPDAGYSLTTTALTGNLVVGPAGVNPPPAFTGDYDGYRANVVGSNVTIAFLFTGSAEVVLDGLTFTGFVTKDGGSAGAQNAPVSLQSASSVVNDCTFIGNTPKNGSVLMFSPSNSKNTFEITNSRFLFNWSSETASGITSYARTYTYPLISNCLFVCSSRAGFTGGNVFNGWQGHMDVRDCTVTRCTAASGSNYNTSYGGPGNLLAAEGNFVFLFTDCVFSNNYTACSSVHNYALVSTGQGNPRFERCSFANNLSRCKPAAGKCYSLFSAYVTGKKMAFDSCTFDCNAIEAPQVSAVEGSYVLAMLGNYPFRLDFGLANCSFVSNVASCASAAGVTPILCRGLATAAYEAGAATGCGLANCSFLGGDDGAYDIVQYGQGHTQPLNLVNCVFSASGDDACEHFYTDTPALLRLWHCSVQNEFTPPAGVFAEGLQSDKVPLAATPADAARRVLVPTAKPAGLRDSADVATNEVSGSLCSWNFRPAASNVWQALCPTYAALTGSGFAAKLIGDAFGATRPAGAFTRGASQALAATAETGATLVLRRDPFTAGAFDGEAVQAVAKGTPTVPVAATANDPSTAVFAGWYDENGDLYSSSATLSLAAPTDDLTILTARFETPPVTLTFDLGGRGTFASTGTDVATVTANAFAPFPEVPAFTPCEGWHFLGFDLPATVPAADTAYAAAFITTAVRVVRVVPAAEAPATQDGTSWASAYTDLKAALADAATYRGEVWMKAGAYTVPLTIPMLSNVAIRGGFAGTETSADEADPAAHPTIITGDVGDNDYWRPLKTKGNLSTHRIWTDASFMPPNPDGADDFWAPVGNSSDDTDYAFSCSASLVTNVVFDGLTFTCFRHGAMRAASAPAGVDIRNCRFLACGTAANETDDSGVVNLINCEAAVSNCLFLGCWRGVTVAGAGGSSVSIDGCSFTNCAGAVRAGVVQTWNMGRVTVRNCRFSLNYCGSEGYTASVAMTLRGASGVTSWNIVSNCLFEANRAWYDCHGTVVITDSAEVQMSRCRFTGNSIVGFKHSGGYGYSACIAVSGGSTTVIRDCLFDGNSAAGSANGCSPYASVLAHSAGSGYTTLLDCTITGNSLDNTSSTTHSATISKTDGRLAVVNCLIDGSVLSGDNAHEIYATDANAFSFVNDVIRNGAPGYSPFAFTASSMVPLIANTIASGYDATALPAVGAYGFLYDNVAADEPLRKAETISGDLPGGVALWAQGARAVRRGFGRPVWLHSDGWPYIHDTTANPAKPWRALHTANGNYFYSSVSGLSLDTPLPADAAGAPRAIGKVAPGPLNAPAPVTVLSVR